MNPYCRDVFPADPDQFGMNARLPACASDNLKLNVLTLVKVRAPPSFWLSLLRVEYQRGAVELIASLKSAGVSTPS